MIMKIYKKLFFALCIFALIALNGCNDNADQFGGNNPKSGYVALEVANSLVISENEGVLSLPVELNTSINPNGVDVSYIVEEINGILPNGFVDRSNGNLSIIGGETTGTLNFSIPKSGGEYSFRVVLTGVNDNDFSIGLSDNSQVVSTDIFVGVEDDILVTIDENPNAGQVLANAAANFTDDSSFLLVNESVEGSLSVDPITGEIRVLDRLAFDWEENPILNATVEIVAGTSSITKNIEINLNDITIFWTGPMTTFVYEGDGDATLPENQDRITDNVWIARGPRFPIYNIAIEGRFNFGNTYPESISPLRTQWAVGSISDGVENLTFNTFATVVASGRMHILNGNAPLVLYLVKDDIYIDLTFIDWHRGNGADGGLGGFSYMRSTSN